MRVAPPGRDGCRCGGFVTGVMLIGEPRLTGVAVTALEDFECAGSGTAFVGVTLSDPFVKAAGIPASGLPVMALALLGVTIRFSFIMTCCDCLSFFSSTSLVSSLRSSSRSFLSPRSRSQISAAVSSLIGKTGAVGISSSSDSDNAAAAAPLYDRPFTFAGSSTISGVSAYDLGSVRGLSTRRPGTGEVLPEAADAAGVEDGDGADAVAAGGKAGVIVSPEFCVNARRSRAVAGVIERES